jgi:3-oxosteroid 1-dehydrogenase
MANIPPGRTPESALSSGWIKKAVSLEELAAKINVDTAGLVSTVDRFNKMASSGIDEDFGRGDSAYDRFFGDSKCKPNPTLRALSKAPFFAMEVWPGDLGTTGGLLTDEFARIVRDDGSPIDGLYATGNTSTSIMGRIYAGSGSTLGPACTFAFIAMDHVAGKTK